MIRFKCFFENIYKVPTHKDAIFHPNFHKFDTEIFLSIIFWMRANIYDYLFFGGAFSPNRYFWGPEEVLLKKVPYLPNFIPIISKPVTLDCDPNFLS